MMIFLLLISSNLWINSYLRAYFIVSFFLFVACDYIDINQTVQNSTPKVKSSRVVCEFSDNSAIPILEWKKVFADGKLAGSINPLLKGDLIFISRSFDFDPPDEVLCYSITDGELLWTWNDYFDKGELLGNVSPFYIYNDKLYICTFGSFYEININSGITQYKNKFGGKNKTGTYGHKNIVSFTYSKSNNYYASILNSENKEFIDLISIPKSNKYNGSITIPLVVNASTYLSFNSYSFEYNRNSSLLNRIDFDDNIPVVKWEREFIGGGMGNFGYEVWGDKLFVAGRHLYCIDISDGSVIWQKTDFHGGPAGLIIADRKLIVASSHIDRSLYAFEPENGELIWKEPLSGSASPLQYHNCVVYTVGGGDGLLHAVDVHSGKHLYKMPSPDYNQNSNLYFDNCTVDPATNSIILTNFKYVLKYRLPDY